MDTYQLLYAKAREKHDEAIDKANRDYQRRLADSDLRRRTASLPPAARADR